MQQILIQNGFKPEEIEDFISHALVIKCPKRTILLREGEVPRFYYWIKKGIIRAGYTNTEGQDITRAFFANESNPFATVYGNMITQTPSLSFLETIEDCELLSWHYDYIKKLEDTDIKWLRFLKKQVDHVFVARDIKERQFYTLSPDELYLSFLETFASFVYRIPQRYIASYLGVSPEALSRIKKRTHTKKK